MPLRRWISATIVAALVAPIVFWLAHIGGAMNTFGDCRIVRQNSTPSPDGSKAVVAVWKECGATVPDSTQASILASGRSYSPGATPTFLSAQGHLDVVVVWNGEEAVKIGLVPGPDRFFKRDQSADGIKIEYE
jgi:hypothetical protein